MSRRFLPALLVVLSLAPVPATAQTWSRSLAADLSTPTQAAPFPSGLTDLAVGPDGDLYVAAQRRTYRLTSATEAPSPAPAGGTGASARTWIAALAIVVLAIGLGLRAWGGRQLRRAGRP